MKAGTPFILALLAWIAVVAPARGQQTEPTVMATLDWAQLETNWKGYFAAPSAENAGLLIQLLPVSGKAADPDNRGETFRQLVDSQMNLLEERLLIESDPQAATIAFRLLTVANGDLEKKVELMLGRFMIFNPRLFLLGLNEYRQAVTHLETILTSYKFDGSLNAESFDLERKHRVKLIEEIDDKDLKNIKKECLKILKGG